MPRLMLVHANEGGEINISIMDTQLRSITRYTHPQSTTLAALVDFHSPGLIVYNSTAASLLLLKQNAPYRILRGDFDTNDSMCIALLQQYTSHTLTCVPPPDLEWMTWCDWGSDIVEGRE